MAGDHPQRAAVVLRAQHSTWVAFHRDRDAWLRENGYGLREVRTEGRLLFRAPYLNPPGEAHHTRSS